MGRHLPVSETLLRLGIDSEHAFCISNLSKHAVVCYEVMSESALPTEVLRHMST